MHLIVHIPHRMTEDDVSALSLARRAPTVLMERVGGEQICVAAFPELPTEIDLALQVVGEAGRLPGAWASIDARPISNLTKLWQRLECYRESLAASDPARHCEEKAELFHTLVGCETRSCPVPCQFLCAPCMQLSPVNGIGHHGQPIEAVADSGEISWCPQLKHAIARMPPPENLLLYPHVRKS